MATTGKANPAAAVPVAKPKAVKRLKAEFLDNRKNRLSVMAKVRKDGSWLVFAKHQKDAAKTADPGMVFVLANEALATAKFNEIVAMAEKAKWQKAAKVAKTPGVPKSTFDAIPAAA